MSSAFNSREESIQAILAILFGQSRAARLTELICRGQDVQAPVIGLDGSIEQAGMGKLGLPYVIGVQNANSAVTGTTNETVLWEVVIPGGRIGLNDVLVCHPILSHTNNANNKTLRVRFGPQALPLTSRPAIWSVVSTATATSGPHVGLRMRNSRTDALPEHVQATTTGSARGFGQSANPLLSQVVDTAVDSVLSVTAQLAVPADTVTLHSVIAKIERVPG